MNSSTTKPSKQLYLVRSSQLSPNHVSIGSHAANTGVGAKQNYATHLRLGLGPLTWGLGPGTWDL